MLMAAFGFKATIQIRDGNPYILVSNDQATTLHPDWHKPMPVIIQVNKQPTEPWHINMMPAGNGDFYLYLHGDVRKASGTKVGDEVAVEIQFDEAYRNGPQHPTPEWFRIALVNNSEAKTNWQLLPPSRQKEVLRYFSRLKSQEAINRNLEKALYVLNGNDSRFMARDWKDGK
jgi:hypothetical protein